ncbi:hypothetical protein N1851_030173 [Merluccius polli]|uniref:F-box domain-containing protein n=1 Tax=Merluccius polli TaxID=89951 RepID=A0AA47M5T6_MERPO|nr:hypothetical protein N1851_030173 [Merluccius polli]
MRPQHCSLQPIYRIPKTMKRAHEVSMMLMAEDTQCHAPFCYRLINAIQMPTSVLYEILKEVVLQEGDKVFLTLALVCTTFRDIVSTNYLKRRAHFQWLDRYVGTGKRGVLQAVYILKPYIQDTAVTSAANCNSLDDTILFQGLPIENGENLRVGLLLSQHKGVGVCPGLLCCLKILNHVCSNLQIKYFNDKDNRFYNDKACIPRPKGLCECRNTHRLKIDEGLHGVTYCGPYSLSAYLENCRYAAGVLIDAPPLLGGNHSGPFKRAELMSPRPWLPGWLAGSLADCSFDFGDLQPPPLNHYCYFVVSLWLSFGAASGLSYSLSPGVRVRE